MSKIKSITGKVVYQNIGLGFWGIEEIGGSKWLPVNMPESLKKEGKTISVRVRELEEEVSIFMWGTPVRIIG